MVDALWAAIDADRSAQQHGGVVRTYSAGGDVVIVYRDGTHETRSDGSRSWRNNNPGNMSYGAFTQSHGAIGQAGGFAVFPTAVMGWQAMIDRLESWPNRTLYDAITDWSETDRDAYRRHVEAWTGIPLTTPLGTLSSAQIQQIGFAITRQEGWAVGIVTWENPNSWPTK
jgi:hypothetical protein